MVFSSILFLFVYLPVVLAVYYIVPARYRNLWLFIVNLVFYGWGEPVYILLMVFSIALNYAAGASADECEPVLVDQHDADARAIGQVLVTSHRGGLPVSGPGVIAIRSTASACAALARF